MAAEYGGRPIGTELEGSVIVATSDTAYQVADGRWIGKAKVDTLRPASPLVALG
jgi:hypothetical protein